MLIEKRNIDSITPYENNVKIHTEEQIEQIKTSILEFGNNDPIAIDENNVVIEGHGRLMALKELGYSEIECVVLNGLSEEQKNAYRLVHNKLTMNSGFDLEGLEKELQSLKSIDMERFEFDLKALEKELSKLNEIEEPKEREDLSDEVGNTYQVIIECEDELQQESLFERLTEEGLICRVLTL